MARVEGQQAVSIYLRGFMSKSAKTRLVLTGVGILLVTLALRSVALQAAGKSAKATVTDVKKATGHQDDAMDHNYQIAYRFAVNGKEYNGSMTRKKVFNTATLPNVGATVPIRYIPSAPMVNGGANESVLGGLALGVLGVVLLIAGIRPRKPAVPEIPPTDVQADAKS